MAMDELPGTRIERHFADLRDPRVERTKRHKLLDIVVLAICGVICGADDWVSMQQFGEAKQEWFQGFLELPNGIPSHDTFGRVFGRLDPDQFQTCFTNWILSVSELTKGQVIAIDGKTLRLSWPKNVIRAEISQYLFRVILLIDQMPPVPTRQTWGTFLRNHAKDIWAVDFLQTYDLFFRAVFVFVVIELGSRRLVHFGVTRSPNDAWVAQQLREATPFGEGPRFLIRDNDNKFGAAFDRVAKGTHIDVLTTPYQAPKANAVCERFLGSVRRECLDFFLILNERHLYKTMKQYQAYFNHARPHQGISQRIPCPSEQRQQDMGRIMAHPVLGGLHHDYRRRTPGGSTLPRAA
jgi:transposase InsO family protein